MNAISCIREVIPILVSSNNDFLQVPLSSVERSILEFGMQNLFESGTSTDVTIEIEGGEIIKAHKLALVRGNIRIYLVDVLLPFLVRG